MFHSYGRSKKKSADDIPDWMRWPAGLIFWVCFIVVLMAVIH